MSKLINNSRIFRIYTNWVDNVQYDIIYTTCYMYTLVKRASNYGRQMYILQVQYQNQRTIGPVNAHLISWPRKAQNIQNIDKIR